MDFIRIVLSIISEYIENADIKFKIAILTILSVKLINSLFHSFPSSRMDVGYFWEILLFRHLWLGLIASSYNFYNLCQVKL